VPLIYYKYCIVFENDNRKQPTEFSKGNCTTMTKGNIVQNDKMAVYKNVDERKQCTTITKGNNVQ